ncbi:MAG: DUF1080 domain-containing protein [Gemmatimonadota bacterium]|nr:DUF1080 domain-containing protein [Gemmatimonadota bacterium]
MTMVGTILMAPWMAAFPACAGDGSGDSGEAGAAVSAATEQGMSDAVQEAPPNRLTAEEAAAGWTLLFDGTLAGWRGYRRADTPAGWSIEDGILTFTPGVGDGDLMTREQFGDFELALEWRIAEGGNSGIFYRATEAERAPYWTGPEFQILHNEGHPDGRTPETSAGSNYALHAPIEDVTRRVGEWNRVRIVLDGARVEHWMNDVKVVEYELWTDEWRDLVASTKFVDWPAYGMAHTGHIGLQDHGDPVWFRNVKIRVAPGGQGL